jgi:hypothetical protein
MSVARLRRFNGRQVADAVGCVEVVVVCSKTALMHALQKIDDELTFVMSDGVMLIAFFAIAIVYTMWA